jgi:hypothetical protein
MAESDDELAKKQVQDAVWQWAGRIIVLAVTFGFGFFAAFVEWGYGNEGQPALRKRLDTSEARTNELDKRRVDLEGQVTVLTGRMADLQKALNRTASPPAAPPPAP